MHYNFNNNAEKYDKGLRTIIRCRETGLSADPGERSLIGYVGELIASEIIANNWGHIIIEQGDAGSKGIDFVTLDPETDTIHLWEVKSSLKEGATKTKPILSKGTRDGMQMGIRWINARLDAVGLDMAEAQDVYIHAMKVDLKSGLAKTYSIDINTGKVISDGATIDNFDL